MRSAPCVAGPGDRLQQMRLAETDAGVDVERVEHHRLAAAGRRHLFGCGMRQRVGASDHEAVESQAQIERRSAERIVSGRDRRIGCAQLADVEPQRARVACGLDDLRRLRIGRRGADHRAAHADLDLLDFRLLGLPAGQQAVGVMRLDPALEEPRRHRQVYHVRLEPFQIHARKPALKNVLADFGAKPFLDSLPPLLIRARSLNFLWHLTVVVELGETDGGADAAVAVTRGYITRSLDVGGTQGAFAHLAKAEAQRSRRISRSAAPGACLGRGQRPRTKPAP